MSRSRRVRGYALIECLVLISVTAALMVLCAGTIHLLLKLDRSGRDAAIEAADLARLARDFRDDAHDAAPGTPADHSAEHVTLPMGGAQTVEYSLREDIVLRAIRDGETVRRFETYRRPARASARFDVTNEGSRAFAAIVFDRPAAGGDLSPYREYRIEAEVGKHRRTTQRPE